MAKPEDGGPAFPLLDPGVGRDCQGMSLRDWFAGMALRGLVSGRGPSFNLQAGARDAYVAADMMLKERAGGH